MPISPSKNPKPQKPMFDFDEELDPSETPVDSDHSADSDSENEVFDQEPGQTASTPAQHIPGAAKPATSSPSDPLTAEHLRKISESLGTSYNPDAQARAASISAQLLSPKNPVQIPRTEDLKTTPKPDKPTIFYNQRRHPATPENAQGQQRASSDGMFDIKP